MKEIDPVDELHEIRKAICKEVGGTPAAYAQYYYEMSQNRLNSDKSTQKHKANPSKPTKSAATRKSRGRKPEAQFA